MSDLKELLRAAGTAGSADTSNTVIGAALSEMQKLCLRAADRIEELERVCGAISNMEQDFRTITKDIKRSSVEPDSPKETQQA